MPVGDVDGRQRLERGSQRRNGCLLAHHPALMAHAIVGARYHLSERFVLRADWAIYTAFVSDQRSTEYRAVTAGVSFFF